MEDMKDQPEKKKECSIFDTDVKCSVCGGMTVPAGSCRVCLNCGSTTGCS